MLDREGLSIEVATGGIQNAQKNQPQKELGIENSRYSKQQMQKSLSTLERVKVRADRRAGVKLRKISSSPIIEGTEIQNNGLYYLDFILNFKVKCNPKSIIKTMTVRIY